MCLCMCVYLRVRACVCLLAFHNPSGDNVKMEIVPLEEMWGAYDGSGLGGSERALRPRGRERVTRCGVGLGWVGAAGTP